MYLKNLRARVTCFLFFAILLSFRLVKSQQAEEEISAPQAIPVIVKVLRGEEVVINLEGATSSINKKMIFLLRSFPKHGLLSKLKVGKTLEDGNKATIIYTSNITSKANNDSFYYAVKHKNSPVSTSVKVNIKIRNKKLSINTPKIINFGKLEAGKTHYLSFQIKNDSLRQIKVIISAQKPFFCDKNQEEIVLNANDASSNNGITEVFVNFKTNIIGNFSRNLQISFFKKQKIVSLRSKSFAPFRIINEPVELVYNKNKKHYSGNLLLSNQSNKTISVEFISNDINYINIVKKINLLPYEQKKIKINTKVNKNINEKYQLKIKCNDFTKKIWLRVKKKIPGVDIFLNSIKIIDNQQIINFKNAKKIKLFFNNIDVFDSEIELAIEAPFILAKKNSKFNLPLKKSKIVEISSKKDFYGEISSKLLIKLANIEKLVIIQGKVKNSQEKNTHFNPLLSSRQKNKKEFKPLNQPSQPKDKIYDISGLSMDKHIIDARIPIVTQCYWGNVRKDSFKLAIQSPDGKDYDYIIELRKAGIDKKSKKMRNYWFNIEKFYQIKKQKYRNLTVFHISNLRENQIYALRILTKAKNGFVSRPTNIIKINTVIKKGNTGKIILFITLILFVIFFYLYKYNIIQNIYKNFQTSKLIKAIKKTAEKSKKQAKQKIISTHRAQSTKMTGKETFFSGKIVAKSTNKVSKEKSKNLKLKKTQKINLNNEKLKHGNEKKIAPKLKFLKKTSSEKKLKKTQKISLKKEEKFIPKMPPKFRKVNYPKAKIKKL